MKFRSFVALATLAAVGLSSGGSAVASSGDHHGQTGPAFTFAVIGDTPYGDAQIAQFPGQIEQINADRKVELVTHLGDIKSGSSVCSDEYFDMIKSNFDRFQDPLVYTPGDNDWTDCHRRSNGSYNPLERLDAVRETFFPRAGRTMGRQSITIDSQVDQGLVENTSWERSKVAFAAVHIVGSNNSLAPWTQNTTATPEQSAEVLGRTAGGVQLIRDTFSKAKRDRDRAVVVFTQADMFDPTVSAPTFADYFAFQPFVRALAEESKDFDGQVYLFNGDSHVYNTDNPLAAGSRWLSLYDVNTPAANFQRITVQGSSDASEWLRVTVQKKGSPALKIERVTFSQ